MPVFDHARLFSGYVLFIDVKRPRPLTEDPINNWTYLFPGQTSVTSTDSGHGNAAYAFFIYPAPELREYAKRRSRRGKSREDGGEWQELYRTVLFFDTPAYVGLAMTSHTSSAVNTTVFSNVTIDGTPLTLADVDYKEIGVPFNTPAPLYIAIKDDLDCRRLQRYLRRGRFCCVR